MKPRRLSILGVGLLGGSIGLALRSVASDCEIVGYGHRKETLEIAVQVGAIDRFSTDPAQAVQGSELVILCTPVGVFEQNLRDIANSLEPGAIITDVGSTKRSVVELAEKLLPGHARFVGSHPMAGSEKRGVEFARTDLFQNALCIVTPSGRTDQRALEQVEGFWRLLGMRIARLSPVEHDQALAEVSHLPHVVAAALVGMQAEAGLKLSGKGFLDTTRIAGGDGGLWRDILLDNRDNLIAAIGKLRQEFDGLETMLRKGDGEAIKSWLNARATRREELLQRKLRELNAD
jgi:prephenate dehydrogenase